MNVSQVCDRAINAELDRLEKGDLASVLERLRVESDRRRGVPYRQGHAEGTRWARENASWAEICEFASMTEADVQLALVLWDQTEEVLDFVGRFKAPQQDYAQMQPMQLGAPGYEIDHSWEADPFRCDQYWRGWLRGVKDIYEVVREYMDPLGSPGDNPDIPL